RQHRGEVRLYVNGGLTAGQGEQHQEFRVVRHPTRSQVIACFHLIFSYIVFYYFSYTFCSVTVFERTIARTQSLTTRKNSPNPMASFSEKAFVPDSHG
ncbi:hypothetical protein, partial [uncultured Adlercreutzia sp.]|uniref:hypothetical protein n=1 Tax=uncultured Adlercreutzia sp. TaxID=875803 RepID=UPI002665CCEA